MLGIKSGSAMNLRLETIFGRARWLQRQPMGLVLLAGIGLLAMRLFVAMPFWASGLTKWNSFPFDLTSSAKYLFSSEFMLHLPGGPYPMPFPLVMAWLSGVGEIVLPLLLVPGLLARPAALGILGMTAIIQITVPGGWPLHLQWALAALLIVVFGPGLFSLDEVIRRLILRRTALPAA